jgi:hypothetical protein
LFPGKWIFPSGNGLESQAWYWALIKNDFHHHHHNKDAANELCWIK